MSAIKEAAAAARDAIKQGAAPVKLAEPAIADAGTGVTPQTGAGQHEGERASTTPAAPQKDEVQVTLLEDKEVEALVDEDDKGNQPTPPARPGDEEDEEEEETKPEAGEEGEEGEQAELTTFALPPVRDGQEPVEVDIDDQEVAERIKALVRGGLRRQHLATAMAEVEKREEELAQFNDAIRIDPVSVVVEHSSPRAQADLGVFLYSLPHVQDAIREVYGDALEDPAAFRSKALELRNSRLERRPQTLETLDQRAAYRQRSREVRNGIAQIIPDEMDQPTAVMLAKDLENDITQYIIANPQEAARLRVTDLPAILERRLALHGITVEEAAERLQETGIAPLPVRARAGANGAPARKPQQPARTGKQLLDQAERRRRAGAVPGSGAGVPAAGAIVLPKKQGVKSRIDSIRELLGIGR